MLFYAIITHLQKKLVFVYGLDGRAQTYIYANYFSLYKFSAKIIITFLQVATAFVGFSVLTAYLTILLLVLLFFMKSTTVFHICGWMQILSGNENSEKKEQFINF